MSARNRQPSLRPGFSIERLEDRRLMAGDVRAQLINGTVFLTETGGTGGGQAVQVSQMHDGRIRVEGGAAADGFTKINGGNAAVFGQPLGALAPRLNLHVNLGGGNDRVVVRDAKLKDVTILAGDSFGQGANDDDFVLVNNVKTSGAVNISTGAGSDSVSVLGTTVGDPTGADDLTVRAGIAGVPGATDLDAVQIQGTAVFGSTRVETGAGADVVSIQNSFFGDATTDPMWIDAGAGADTVELGTTRSLGVVAGPVVARGDLSVFGDSFSDPEAAAGDDVVRMQDVSSPEFITVNLLNGNDVLEMTNIHAKFVNLHGEKGNDTFRLTEVYALDTVFAKMGDGDDTLDMVAVRAHRVETDGGAGALDKLTTYDMANIPLTRTGFEFVNGKRVQSKGGANDLGGLTNVEFQSTR